MSRRLEGLRVNGHRNLADCTSFMGVAIGEEVGVYFAAGDPLSCFGKKGGKEPSQGDSLTLPREMPFPLAIPQAPSIASAEEGLKL